MKRDITIIGVPLDLGADRRGVDMGPSAIRYANAKQRLERIGFNVEDAGNLYVPSRESFHVHDGNLKYAGIGR